MKKQLFKMMLLGVFALASCQKDELSSNKGELVTFNLIPESIATRSGSASSVVTRYVMEVYQGWDLTQKPIYHLEQESGTFNVGIDASLQYVYLFWADNGTPDNNTTGTYNALNLREVIINADKEMTQAFFARLNLSSMSIMEHNITLKRPMAQVNLIATEVLSREIAIVTNFKGYTSFDTSSGEVIGDTVDMSQTIYPTNTIGKIGSFFTFASVNGITSDFNFVSSNKNNRFKNVPMKANYITNISGNFSIQGGEFIFDIDQVWDGELNVAEGTMNINIPDSIFKVYLIAHFDINGDNEISYDEALVVNYINCGSRGIASLEGIEHFTNLTTLYCYSNSLTSLDVSKNTKLINFKCYSNRLTSLDVSNNTKLTLLYCYSNSLTSLDVSKNTVLVDFRCYRNSLTSLDVSKNTVLYYLYCNPMATLKTITMKRGQEIRILDKPSSTTTDIIE